MDAGDAGGLLMQALSAITALADTTEHVACAVAVSWGAVSALFKKPF